MKKNTLTRIFAMAAAGVGLAGCATVQNPDPRDPWEGFNRGVYTFNDKVDRAVLRPIAVGYTTVTPQPVQSCIHNVFNNFADIWAAANSMLQGRGTDAINTFGRFLFNTTMGVGGCFDVATANGAKRIPNDFGTTLGVWGVGQGPYVVLPFWGSSTIRDTAGLAGDFVGNQWTSVGAIDNVPVRNSLYGLWAVDRRASLLDATDTVDRVALDPYSFVRDAYLQRRAAMVLGRKADSSLPNYDDEGDDDTTSGSGAGTGAAPAPAAPGIGGAGGGTVAPTGTAVPAKAPATAPKRQ
uniref:MlaA family lipoprotein n=1 Tax=Bordetella sputigena TaxID=1416810 RepID=UPI0039F0D1F5